MLKWARNVAFLVMVGAVSISSAEAVPLASCDWEQFACSRAQWDFDGCADSCTALLQECIANCNNEAPEDWVCTPPGAYEPPNKKSGWCYCYTGPCAGG